MDYLWNIYNYVFKQRMLAAFMLAYDLVLSNAVMQFTNAKYMTNVERKLFLEINKDFIKIHCKISFY